MPTKDQIEQAKAAGIAEARRAWKLSAEEKTTYTARDYSNDPELNWAHDQAQERETLRLWEADDPDSQVLKLFKEGKL